MPNDPCENANITIYSSLSQLEKRGLIISNQVGRNFYDGRPIEPEILRMLVLFFDMIDVPQGPEDLLRFFHTLKTQKGRSDDENFLIQENFITRSLRIPKQSGQAFNVDRGQFYGLDLFEQREKKEPGRWALATIHGLRPNFNPMQEVSYRSVNFEIFKNLPIPHAETPLEECIRFKEKYYGELLELRFHIGNLGRKINESEDVNWAYADEVSKIIKSCRDYTDALDGASIKYFLNNLSFDFTLIGTAAGLYSTFPDYQIPIIASTVIARIAKSNISRKSSNPFSYMWSMNKEMR